MALPVRDQFKYWGIATVVFALVLWLLGDVLLPFILGGAVAYFLDPVADRLERMGLSRAMATATITVLSGVLFAVLLLAVFPQLVQQAVALVEIAPQLVLDLQTFLKLHFPILWEDNSIIRDTLAKLGATVQDQAGQVIGTVFNSAKSMLGLVTVMVIAPVVSVYLLLDWDRMVARIDGMVPRDHVHTVRRLAGEIDSVLSGFVRGMGSVCIILGIYYAMALWMVGLNFGLIVGVIAGGLTFIPYVGALIGGLLAIGLALFQFWGDWPSIIAVWLIFQSGQFIEGNFLTPRLVGSSVGLHPVWLLLALSVFGSLFGFVGMLVAVPVAAAIGVLARFGVSQYQHSRLYLGLEQNEDE